MSTAPNHPHGPRKLDRFSQKADSAILHGPDGSFVDVQVDGDGHIVSGSNTDKGGLTRRLFFSPWPMKNRLEYTEEGQPRFVVTIWTTLTDFVYTYDDEMTKRVDYVFIPHGPNAEPQLHYKVIQKFYDGREPIATDERPLHLSDFSSPDRNPLAHVIERHFPQYQHRLDIFSGLTRRADTDVFQFDQATIDQLKAATEDDLGPLVFYKLGWGTIGRAVVWGLAGVGAAALAAPGVAIGSTAYLGIFLTGFDASGITEIWSDLESQGGKGPDDEEKKKTEGKNTGGGSNRD